MFYITVRHLVSRDIFFYNCEILMKMYNYMHKYKISHTKCIGVRMAAYFKMFM